MSVEAMKIYWVSKRLLTAERLSFDGNVAQVALVRKACYEQALAKKDVLHEMQVREVVERLNDDFRFQLVENEKQIACLTEQVSLLNRKCCSMEHELAIDLPSKERAFVDDLQRRLRLGYQFTKRDCVRVLKLLRKSRQDVRKRLGQAVLFANYLRYSTDLECDENQEARAFLASADVLDYDKKGLSL